MRVAVLTRSHHHIKVSVTQSPHSMSSSGTTNSKFPFIWYFIGFFWLCSLNDKPIAWKCSISYVINRNRTSSKYVCYSLYLYFSGLLLRKTSERFACSIKRNHLSIWNWIQKYHLQKLSYRRRNGVIIEYRTSLPIHLLSSMLLVLLPYHWLFL